MKDKCKVKINCDPQEEIDALREICRRQERDMDSLRQHNDKLALELESSYSTISDLRARIKFLEGQIDAYQYCLNCRK